MQPATTTSARHNGNDKERRQQLQSVVSRFLPTSLESLRGSSSVQILHELNQQQELKQKRQTSKCKASPVKARRSIGLGIKALLMAGVSDDGSAPMALSLVGTLVEEAKKSLREVSPSQAATSPQATVTSDRLQRPTSVPVSPMRQQHVVALDVVQAVHRAISAASPPHQQRRDVDDQEEGTRHKHRGSPTAGAPMNDDDADMQAQSERQRQLQQAMWKKIGYGTDRRVGASSREGSTSPIGEAKVSPQRGGDGSNALQTTRQSLSRNSFSRSSFRGGSPINELGFSFTSLQRQSSVAGGFGSQSGSPLRRGDSRRSFFRDMPSAEDLQEAFEETRRRCSKASLRVAARCTPIANTPDSSPPHGRPPGGQHRRSHKDAVHAARRTTVAEELGAMLHNCVTLCRVAAEVSPVDGPMQSIFDTVGPLLRAPPQLGDGLQANTTSDDFELEGEAQLRDFGFEAQCSLRWAAVSFSHLPRSTITVAVASDAAATGYVEIPGSGRAGAAGISTTVFGSTSEMLQHDALHTMLMEGIHGLESVGRAVLTFLGPLAMQRAQLTFAEDMRRVHVERRWVHELTHRVLQELRIAKGVAEKRKSIAAGATSFSRDAQDHGRVAAPPTRSAVNFSAVYVCAGLLADGARARLQALQHRGIFARWCERAKVAIAVRALGNSVAALPASYAKRRKQLAAEAMRGRTQTDLMASTLHTFVVACMRKKQQRHLNNIRILEAAAQRKGTGRKEVLVASAASAQAAKLVTALKEFAQRQGMGGEPYPITLTGHSSGGAVALLAACMINAACDPALMVSRVVTFGAPRAFHGNATDILQGLGVMHVCVATDKDPAIHQPWTFDPTGTGCFVVGGGVDAGATSAGTSSLQRNKQHHPSALVAETAVPNVRPCPWSEVPPTPAAAQAHWVTYHCLHAYLSALAPAVAAAAKPFYAAPPDIAERLRFEQIVLHPSPVRGASHGFSAAAMRCLQHIATRYGVGNLQKIPRDVLLAVIGSCMNNASLHLHAERVPVGQGGRIDQASFIMWCWSETVINPRFLSAFLAAFKYEYSGKDYFPSQKALIAPPPPPKILPVAVLCQSDGALTLSTIGRGAMDALFGLYAKEFTLSPMEFRVAPGTRLLSRKCIEAFLHLSMWTHRCTATDAVACIYHRVAVAHLNQFSSSPRRATLRVHDRLAAATLASKQADVEIPVLMSFGGELTRTGFQLFMQLFVQTFGLVQLQHALWHIGFRRQWDILVSKAADISNDIHWTYGPCGCLADAQERKRIHAEEDRIFKAQVSVLATEIASAKRRAPGAVGPRRSSTVHPLLLSDAVSCSSGATPMNISSPQGQHRDSTFVCGSISSPSAEGVGAAMLQKSFSFGDPSAVPTSPVLCGAEASDVLASLELVHTAVISPPEELSRWTLPATGAHWADAFNSTMYSTSSVLGAQWSASGNGKRLQREARKGLKQYIEDSRAGTSVGNKKPRHRLTQAQRSELRAAVRDPSTNGLPTLSAMYGPKNVLRLLNPSQRKVLQLPPLQNQLLVDGAAMLRDPILEEEQ